MIELRWSDIGIEGECADKIMKLLKEWYSDEDDVMYVQEDIIMELKAITDLCTDKEWLDFFDVMACHNIDVITETGDVKDMVESFLAGYLEIENKEKDEK